MRFAFSLVMLCVGVTMALPFAQAAEKPKENPRVMELAREGYWLKNRQEIFDKAMAMLGKSAPGLPLTDWRGTPQNLEKLKGKIVVIDFWATWCGPCIAQIPHANEVAGKYADKGVVLYGACDANGSAKMNDTAEEHGMKYPTGKLTKEVTGQWQIQFWPTYAVVDRYGTLRAIGLQPDYLEKVIDELLAEQPAQEAVKK